MTVSAAPSQTIAVRHLSQCSYCGGRIPEGGYYFEVNRWRWACPACARRMAS